MESMIRILEKSDKGETNENEELTVLLEKTDISSEDRKNKEKTSSNPCMKELALKSPKFYKEKIGLSPSNFVVPRKIYKKLGQFYYKGEEDIEDLKQRIGYNENGNKWIYIGQFKSGTEIRDGIGICIRNDGATLNN